VTTTATPVRRAGWRAELALPAAGLIVCALTVTVGLVIRATTRGLGAPLPPFSMFFSPELDPLLAVTVLVAGGAATLAPRVVDWATQPARVAGGLFALALALGLSLNLARAGVSGWTAVFTTGAHGSPEAPHEYLPGLPALSHGVGYYVGHFPRLLTVLPTHVRGNPPGPLVALHLLGIHTAAALTALCVGLGALTAPLAYDLGRVLGGEQRGRLAGVMTAFAPSLLLFGVTSVDYAFATLGLAAACLLARRHPAALLAGGVLAAVASFFSWLLLAIPAWATIAVLRREGPRRALVCACVSAGLILALNVALALSLGYDPIATFRVLDRLYRHGAAASRPYAFWLFGSPVAWALMLGIPTAWLAVRSLAVGDPAAVALAAVVLTAAVLGFTKAETERIWLPFVPLACVAAAATMSARTLRPLLWSLVAQALVVEVLFDTAH
jgi:methylthioxylose transferase